MPDHNGDCELREAEEHTPKLCRDCSDTTCEFFDSAHLAGYKCFVAKRKAAYNDSTVLGGTYSIKELALLEVYKCKEAAYGAGTDASNDLEGDFGTWDEWEKVLCDFAVFVLNNAN